MTKRKRVRPMSIQGECESRKLWHKVTEALKAGEIDTATRHKRFVCYCIMLCKQIPIFAV